MSKQSRSQQPSHRAMPGMTRRNALITGAGVAAGSAAVAGGLHLSLGGNEAVAATPASADANVPVILRLTDARRGAFDVYVGTDVVHVTDRSFASRLSSATSRSRH